MDKILSIQTIKNVFAALGAKTSDDNYGVALLDKTTAEPKGLMSMSNLASVLGTFRIGRGILPSCNLNDVSSTADSGCWVLHSNNTYTNNNGVGNANFFVFNTDGGGRCIQAIVLADASKIHVRGMWVGNWDTWKTITLS